MAHPSLALNSVRVRNLKEAGRYADGNGLYLVVDPSGAKRWLLRTVIHGKRRDIGLGGLRLVSLAEARTKATELRKIAREGGDPLAERRRAERQILTFGEAAQTVHQSHSKAWKNKKHVDQWINTVTAYALPHFGSKRVDLVDTADILRALSPIWLTKPETARRLKQRIGAVIDWAIASGFREGANPISSVSKGLPKQQDRDEHFKALPYAEVPDFVQRLRSSNRAEVSKLAFEFLILTAMRTTEVLEAPWEEIDLKTRVWNIPAVRMKRPRDHRVPLCSRAIEILGRAKELSAGSEFIFPGRSGKKPMSNMVFSMTLRRMDVDVTAHGFRSSFRDWAAEQTNFPRDVCEMALAHAIKNKAEAAYRRGDLLEKRRELMETWSRFLARPANNVIALTA